MQNKQNILCNAAVHKQIANCQDVKRFAARLGGGSSLRQDSGQQQFMLFCITMVGCGTVQLV